MADKSPGGSLIPIPIKSSKKSTSDSPKSVRTIQKIYEEEPDDKIELRKSNSTRAGFSKSEYIKLQRNTSSGERIEKLKEKYQKKRPKSEGSLTVGREINIDKAINEADKPKLENQNPVKEDKIRVSEVKSKSATLGLDSPKVEKKVSFTDILVNPKEPIPRPRKSLESLKKIPEIERENPFLSDSEVTYAHVSKPPEKSAKKDGKVKQVRVGKVKFNEIQYAEPESRHIIVRQESTDSINLIQKGLDSFEMDDKKIGRRSSFKGIKSFFTSKAKKKEEVKVVKNQNVLVGENYENEGFNRASPVRHTTDSAYHKNFQPAQNSGYYKDNNVTQAEIENNFAQMHMQKYTEVKKRFSNGAALPKPPEDYVSMENAGCYPERDNSGYISDITKNHDTCSSNSKTDSEHTNSTYENALIAQAEMIQRQNQNQNQNNHNKPQPPQRATKLVPDPSDRRTDTPPRAQETYQNFELIKPRASIPINSERPLPNPFVNTNEDGLPTNKTIERNLNNDTAKFSPIIGTNSTKEVLVNDIYGTVFDAKLSRAVSPTNFAHKPSTKIRLPANREKVELVPRMKSPIPQPVVSTDKIIATELLKNRKGKEDKANVSTHQNLSIEIDYPPENCYNNNSQTVTPSPRLNRSLERPKISPAPQQNNIIGRTVIPTETTPIPTENTLVHIHRPLQNQQQISPYYTPTPLQDRRNSLSLSPSKRFSPSPLTRSPSKQEIRQSVEAFCWKEIKKLKDKQEDQLYGYVLDPGRSRSMAGGNHDRGRRSLSLPREMPKARRNLEMYQQQVMMEPVYDVSPNGQYFVRNSPQRRTIESMHKSSGQLYSGPTAAKPIFNRGSLQQQQQQQQPSNTMDYNKKVSFINSQTIQPSWPTRNGYMQNPPQRRLDSMQRMESMEDDVFLAQNSRRIQRPPSASNQHHQQQQIEHQRRLYEQQLQQQEAIYGRLGQQQHRRLTLEEMHYLKQQQMNQDANYGRRQVAESLYGRTVAPVVFNTHPKDVLYNHQQMQRMKMLEESQRNIQSQQEPIYGVRYGTPVPRTTTDGPSRGARPILPPPVSVDYGGYTKHVRVNNKECDIYGQIHEKNQLALRTAQMQQSGVMYGQLQRNVNAGPVQHKSYNQIGQDQHQNFVRNSRLTASANDMHRNGPYYQHQRSREFVLHEEPIYGQQSTVYYDSSGAPLRPLPPVPNNIDAKKAVRLINRSESINDADRQFSQQEMAARKNNGKRGHKTKGGK